MSKPPQGYKRFSHKQVNADGSVTWSEPWRDYYPKGRAKPGRSLWSPALHRFQAELERRVAAGIGHGCHA